MNCLETHSLHHRFGPQPVLTGIDLQVPQGSIYGFLGANGAGKTTTLRLLLGLLRVQQGEVRIFGKHLQSDRLAILRRVGSMIESPSLYDHLTAAENLKVAQIVHRCAPGRIAEVLARVGLANTGRKRVKQFSLGMRQRLGIATSLLHDPSLIILDEPTNGLDPEGIIEIRTLLRELNREHGCTILVSSHLLSEVDRLVTDVGILGNGKLLFQGSIDELRRRGEEVLSVHITTSDNVKAAGIVSDTQITTRIDDGKIVLPSLPDETIAALNRRLTAHDIDVYEIRRVRPDLESIFLNLIAGSES